MLFISTSNHSFAGKFFIMKVKSFKNKMPIEKFIPRFDNPMRSIIEIVRKLKNNEIKLNDKFLKNFK